MGISWDKVTVRVGHAGRVRTEPGWRLDRAWSQSLQDCDLWLVWAGRGTMRTRGESLDLRPGVCLWMRPGGIYLAEHDPKDRLGVTFIHFDLLDICGQPMRLARELPREVYELADLTLADVVTQRIVALIRQATRENARRSKRMRTVAGAMLKSLLMWLELEAAARSTSAGTSQRYREQIGPLVARILEEPGRVESVTEMARAVGYAPDHFARIFAQVTGQSPRSFIIQARLDRAKMLLTESGLSIKEIAAALGYRNVFFFSRQFTRWVGVPPTRYRQRQMPGRASARTGR